jgi:CMD domain protein
MSAMSTPDVPDVMDHLTGLAPDSRLGQLRRQRPDVVRHLQRSDAAIFTPADDGGLSAAERAAAALRVAVLLRDARLQEHYRARVIEHGGSLLIASAADLATPDGEPRWRSILGHVDRLTTAPDSAQREHINALLASGLSPRALIALSQLVAYVNFQARVRAGLRLLGGTHEQADA